MRIDDFDYDLPPDRVALRPARPRDAARMLVVRPGAPQPLEDRGVCDLPELLRPGDALVFNDTRVIRAELKATRHRAGGQPVPVSVTLHKRLDESRWCAFARPAKRLKPGDRLTFGHEGRVCLLGTLAARVEAREAEEATLAFDFHGPVLDEAVAALGDVPLPPYIAARRPPDEADAADYQTVFARAEGAVAAPTAGLHFTDTLLAALDARGLNRHFVTLHVGGGTFLPVRADRIEAHEMHGEWGEVSAGAADALNAARAAGGRIVAVGTTALRLLETAADKDGTIRPFNGETRLYVTPGYAFKAVDVLMTNFHLPRSTLFMLVAAFSGLDLMKRAYAHAIGAGYRFYSYGDACLLHPQGIAR